MLLSVQGADSTFARVPPCVEQVAPDVMYSSRLSHSHSMVLVSRSDWRGKRRLQLLARIRLGPLQSIAKQQETWLR